MTATTTATDKPCANPRRSIHAISAKAAGALIAIQLILAGCTGGISPTVSPTTETPKPALTAPLPTATKEHTKTPTLTPTPTEIPVKATPDSSRYPTTISDQPLTDETLEKRKTDFATLVSSNKTVASEFRTIETRIGDICDNGCTIEGVLDQDHWGVIARNSDGIPLVLQKTKDGGRTWVTMPDANLWGLADKFYSPGTYRLIPIKRPAVPETATADVIISDGGWWVYVWRDKTSGKILAWYDAANDQYLTVDGKKLELKKTYAYTPLSEMTTWEECVAPEQQLPWIEDPEFEEAFEAFIEATNPTEPLEQYDYSGLSIGTPMVLLDNPTTAPITSTYNWSGTFLMQTKANQEPKSVLSCATMRHPNGKDSLLIIRFPVRAIPDTQVENYGTAFINLTLAVDLNLLQKDTNLLPGTIDLYTHQLFKNQFQGMKNTGAVDFYIFSKTIEPISSEELQDSLVGPTATLIQQVINSGAQDALWRLLTYSPTKEDIFTLEHSILPASYFEARIPQTSQ